MIGLLGSLLPTLGLLAVASTSAPPVEDPPNNPGGLGGFGIVPTTTAPSDGAKLARMDLLTRHRTIAPGGETLLGVRWRIAPKWHMYWRNPGDSGTAPRITVTGMEGLKVGDIRWPRPVVFKGDWGDTTYGYEGEVVLLVPIRIPADAPEGPLELDVQAEWLVCKGACLLGDGQGSVQLEVRSGTPGRETPNPAIEQSLALVPAPLKQLEGSTARLEPTTNPVRLVIEGPAGEARNIDFIPDLTPGVVAGEGHPVRARITENGISEKKFRIEVPLVIEPDNSEGRPLVVAGLVVFGPGSKDPARSVRLPIDP